MRRVLLALVLVVLEMGTAFSAEVRDWTSVDLRWDEYRNERFGITAEYPSRVFRFERASTAGDGELFVSKDGRARLLIGALENREHFSPRILSAFHSIPILSGPEGRLFASPWNLDSTVGHHGGDDGL